MVCAFEECDCTLNLVGTDNKLESGISDMDDTSFDFVLGRISLDDGILLPEN